MERAHTMRLRHVLAASLLFGGCTVITGVNDYEVDPTVENRDLDYTFVNMKAHATTPLDVAVVAVYDDGTDPLLQARARIMLPPAPEGAYPDERLVMENALVPGPQKLYFFADSTPENNRFDEKDDDGNTAEHVWVKDVDPSGVDTFVHSTMFQPFDEDEDFGQLNGDVVLAAPLTGQLVGENVGRCLVRALERELSSTFEAKIFLSAEDRQVGLFRTYKGNPLPKDGEVRLRGIVDAGNEYRLEIYVDDTLTNSKDLTAPASGDMVIRFEDWFPVSRAAIAACARD